MALMAFRRLMSTIQPSTISKILPRFHSKIYEPDYLEALKPKYPLYPPLSIQIKGYDYPIVEKYQSYVHKIANIFDFDVEESYAMPAKQLKIVIYKPQSTVVDVEYQLNVYERDIKVSNVPSVRLPIFIQVIEKAIPEGVTLEIDEFSEEKYDRRYIPDKRLLDMRSELEEIKRLREEKKK